MAIPKPMVDYKYSYADYLSWPDGERWEIIEGVPYDMSPAPSPVHQRTSVRLTVKIGHFLEDKPCQLFAAPFDVRLQDSISDEAEAVFTVVQPDLLIVCDKAKLDERGCNGAPDLCIEILSPATAYKDQTEKLKLYEKHGVREYWIVNTDLHTIVRYISRNGVFGRPDYFEKNDILNSPVLAGFELNLAEVLRDSEK